jgi:hypothetical protein
VTLDLSCYVAPDGSWDKPMPRSYKIKLQRLEDLPFVCFVIESMGITKRAPRALPIIASYLTPERVVNLFQKNITDRAYEMCTSESFDPEKEPRNFVMFRMSVMKNKDTDLPQRSGTAPPRPFFLSRNSEHMIQKNLTQKLQKMGRHVGYVEDLEESFMHGGANGLAKYLASFDESKRNQYHFTLGYNKKYVDVVISCEVIFPQNLDEPGVLRYQMMKGRPLKEEHEHDVSLASLACVSCAQANTDGWVWSESS